MPRKIAAMLFSLLTLMFISSQFAYAQNNENQMTLHITKIDQSSIWADAMIMVSIPQGEGYSYFALPFSNTTNLKYKIESPIQNEILSGFSNKSGEYLVFQIQLTDLSSVLKIHLKDIEIRYNPSLDNINPNSFIVAFDKANNELLDIYKTSSVLKLDSLIIDGIKCDDTIPTKE